MHLFSIQTVFSNILLVFLVFFPIYMTILLMLSVRKDKNSNFRLIVSIKCYNLLFIFPGFCSLSFQDRENVAAKSWMYHSHSSPSLASSALTSCTPFQPIDNVSCHSTFCLCHNPVVRCAPVIVTHCVFPELTYRTCSVVSVFSVTMK